MVHRQLFRFLIAIGTAMTKDLLQEFPLRICQIPNDRTAFQNFMAVRQCIRLASITRPIVTMLSNNLGLMFRITTLVISLECLRILFPATFQTRCNAVWMQAPVFSDFCLLLLFVLGIPLLIIRIGHSGSFG